MGLNLASTTPSLFNVVLARFELVGAYQDFEDRCRRHRLG